MVKMQGRWLVLLVMFSLTSPSYSWNSVGHRLVAQIAYDYLNMDARRLVNYYNHALDKKHGTRSFVNAASWLDTLHSEQDEWLRPMHYINIPFTCDGTLVHPPNRINAVTAIENALFELNNPHSTLFTKGLNLRILLHVAGDLHQPMHAVSQYSRQYPEGDKGGNRVRLAPNQVAPTLHAYWDNGGGWLKRKHGHPHQWIKRAAHRIEKQAPCDTRLLNDNPKVWANESHQLAIEKAYGLKAHQKPSKPYQRMVKKISEQRIALAGCRLAFVLNALAK